MRNLKRPKKPGGAALLAVFTLLLASLTAPAPASAFKLIKASGAAITKHTEIHFTDDVEAGTAGDALKCELNATLTTNTGEAANTFVINPKLVTNSCVGSGLYKGCQVTGDAVSFNNVGKVAIDNNALTFGILALVDFAAGCPVTFAKAEFEPLKTIVGIGPITTGIVEGKGEIENDKGKLAATASGEMTLGQYTELGVNQGSAKGVFKIQ